MKKLVIFAGYDKDNMIDDYVIYYIKELKKIANIIYVSDCNMLENELSKISQYCIHIINGRHGEYDFGSYKRGYFYAKEKNILKDYDYLMFINDSVYGPFFDLKEIVEKMENKNYDAWSMFHCFDDKFNKEHLNSYFLVINKSIFLTEKFSNFVNNYRKEPLKHCYIVKYEIGTTRFFRDNSYKIGGYLDSSLNINYPNVNLPFWDTENTIRNGFPFLKRSVLNERHLFGLHSKNLLEIINIIRYKYDINLIFNNMMRVTNIQYIFIPEIINNKNDNKRTYFSLLQICSFNLFSIEKKSQYVVITIFGIKISIKV